MPGTKTVLGIFLFIAFVNIASDYICPHLKQVREPRRRLIKVQRLLAHPNPQASASSLSSAACLLEICSTRTCEIRGLPEIVASDPAGPPTRTGAFIAKNAAETIKKLWMYLCFTAFSFNCVHRCVQQSRTFVLFLPATPARMCIDRGFEYPRRERFPDDIKIRPFLHVVTPVRC